MMLTGTQRLFRSPAGPAGVPRRPKLTVLAAASGGNGDNKAPRRRSSSKNADDAAAAPAPPPAAQLASNLAAKGSSSSSGKPSSSSSGTPPPASQLANNLAGAGGGEAAAGTPPPAAQLADSLAASSSGSSSSSAPESPVDLLQQGIRAAADVTQEVIAQSAAVATGGIEAAASLSQRGLSAAEAAAEEAARALGGAAQSGLNTAASAAGGAAGAASGLAASAAGGSSTNARRGGSSSTNGGGAVSSADFESVSVRVPAPAWANATREKGRVRDATLTQDFDEDEVQEIKVMILGAVASLDRGLAANVREARDVDRLARRLEDAAGPVSLRWQTSRSSPDSSTMEKLGGTWRLIYSSGFNGGSLGGSRPGPPAALSPTILGQIYQVVDEKTMTLDNVVELLLSYGLPQLPFLPRDADPSPTPGLRATLRHTYDVTPPSTVKIVFESTAVKAIGGPDFISGLPQVALPELPDFLKPPRDLRSASFRVTFLDSQMRITRGDRNELRIYLRDRPLEVRLPVGDDEDRDYD